MKATSFSAPRSSAGEEFRAGRSLPAERIRLAAVHGDSVAISESGVAVESAGSLLTRDRGRVDQPRRAVDALRATVRRIAVLDADAAARVRAGDALDDARPVHAASGRVRSARTSGLALPAVLRGGRQVDALAIAYGGRADRRALGRCRSGHAERRRRAAQPAALAIGHRAELRLASVRRITIAVGEAARARRSTRERAAVTGHASNAGRVDAAAWPTVRRAATEVRIGAVDAGAKRAAIIPTEAALGRRLGRGVECNRRPAFRSGVRDRRRITRRGRVAHVEESLTRHDGREHHQSGDRESTAHDTLELTRRV